MGQAPVIGGSGDTVVAGMLRMFDVLASRFRVLLASHAPLWETCIC